MGRGGVFGALWFLYFTVWFTLVMLGEAELVAPGGKWGAGMGDGGLGVKYLARSGVDQRGDGGSAGVEQAIELGGDRGLVAEDLPLLGLVSWRRGPRPTG